MKKTYIIRVSVISTMLWMLGIEEIIISSLNYIKNNDVCSNDANDYDNRWFRILSIGIFRTISGFIYMLYNARISTWQTNIVKVYTLSVGAMPCMISVITYYKSDPCTDFIKVNYTNLWAIVELETYLFYIIYVPTIVWVFASGCMRFRRREVVQTPLVIEPDIETPSYETSTYYAPDIRTDVRTDVTDIISVN
jgi:hypothetical protein